MLFSHLAYFSVQLTLFDFSKRVHIHLGSKNPNESEVTKQTNKQKTYINIICNSELETSSLILGLGKDVPSHHCFLKLFLIGG